MTDTLAIKLKSARESLGFTLAEAASKIGFSNYQTLSQIESGHRQVKASELLLFSKYYFLSINELLDVNTKSSESEVYFLWRDAPSENQRKTLEKNAIFLSEQCEWMEKALNLKNNGQFKLLEVSTADIISNYKIDNLAQKAASLLKLGSRPALTLKNVLEQEYSVKVFYESLPDGGSAATTLHPKFGAIIVINSDEPPWRRNFDLAHELFHLLTWKIVTQQDLADPQYFTDIEKKADRFASTLLLPSDEVKSELFKRISDHKITTADFVDVAREFCVSSQALVYRLVNLNILSWDQSQEILKNSDIIHINKERCWEEWGEKPKSQLLINLAISALRKGYLSRGKFAQLCEVDRCDVDIFIEKNGRLNSDGENSVIMDT